MLLKAFSCEHISNLIRLLLLLVDGVESGKWSDELDRLERFLVKLCDTSLVENRQADCVHHTSCVSVGHLRQRTNVQHVVQYSVVFCYDLAPYHCQHTLHAVSFCARSPLASKQMNVFLGKQVMSILNLCNVYIND